VIRYLVACALAMLTSCKGVPDDIDSSILYIDGAELPYVFGAHDEWLPTEAGGYQIGEAMMSYWLNFAGTVNPNDLGVRGWLLYSGRSADVLQLDTNVGPIVHTGRNPCSLLKKYWV